MQHNKEWKCGKCAKEYTFEEFRALATVKAVEADTDPWQQHGFTPVCTCGYTFGKDKWHLVDSLEIDTLIGKVKLTISTVFLELNHFGYWYETMIFRDSFILECDYQERYVSREEATIGHKKVITQLKEKQFNVELIKYSLVLGR